MKQVAVLLFIFLLFIGSSCSGLTQEKTRIKNEYEFTAQDITLADDAFHGRENLPFTEWWYFEAMFDNGYALQMSIRIASTFEKGIVYMRMDIYKNGTFVTHDSTFCPLSEIDASAEIPLVQIKGKTIIFGSCDNTTGDFIYNLSCDFPGIEAQLRFQGTTKGWKGQLQNGAWWAVVLPRADVTGTLRIDDTTMSVNGTGYHDHDWDIGGRVCVNFGWFWGTFSSPEYTITWAAILTTRATLQPIMVVNQKNAGYLTIPAQNTLFFANDIHLDHFMLVPQSFHIQSMTDSISLEINMDALNIRHERFMGIMNYWRYHVKCTGTIMVDGHAETVEGVFIAEFLRFR